MPKLRPKLIERMTQLGNRAIAIGRLFHETALHDLIEALRHLDMTVWY